MPQWLILTTFAAALAVTVGSTVYHGAIDAAEQMFMADSFAAKWIVNEHYEGE